MLDPFMFTEEEILKLIYIQAQVCLERFEEYWKESGDFDNALVRAFPDVEEYESSNSTSR